ncbi:G-patch domain-containing protein [Colletotrichum orchidophilum]|uniref:PinX1-related protein 1 n=1 Tax=Colletotrichum orchidophilum TaxID=1209926 RepID=A0A1G4BC53_9PEZI|nr:G-patch domain-containing protein [Colletotrichum orchidophilum]OHE98978.1 G-patch domain-containing protein [Colletotrichum orchidophilum]
MGLAQAKTRRKIGKDPNNTKWTKDLDSFGQKILRSQGWEPGQYLGAKDAAHAVHHTAANASFIRVALKDDMLGLGFKQARDDRVTGMDVFSDLLGRLNGKSTEVIAKEQEARTALKSTLYCDNKFGPMRFVSGGFLVGDKIKEEPTADPKGEDSDDDDVKMEDVPIAPESSNKSKKRKAEESSEDESSSEDEKAKKKRRKEEKKASKKLKAEADGEETSTSEKKDKKRKSKSAKEDASEDTQDETEKKSRKDKKNKKAKKEAGDEEDSSDDKSLKKKRKGENDAEKAARKEEKKRRKEEKRAKKEASRESTSTTPTVSGTSTPVLRGHHAVRSRWIAQKRMATMDDKALNAIFMYFINLATLATIGSLSVRISPSGDEEPKLLLAVPAVSLFLVSGVGVIITMYDVWPRTGHRRLLGSILGFTATLVYAITIPSWTFGIGQVLGRGFYLLSGFHVGFWLESVTGFMGRVLKALENSKEEPLPQKNRSADEGTARAQLSSSSAAQDI